MAGAFHDIEDAKEHIYMRVPDWRQLNLDGSIHQLTMRMLRVLITGRRWVDLVRFLATAAGGFMAGIGGAFLSLSYPGIWSQGLSSGQGLVAVALVIFARWDPIRAIYAALLFGAAGALGPSLQSIGITQGYYFFNAAPYVVTLFIMIASSSTKGAFASAPGELAVTR